MFTLTGKEKEKDKRSFFERLTGTINLEEDDEHDASDVPPISASRPGGFASTQPAVATKIAPVTAPLDPEEGELAVDVYQTDREIIVQAMVAGVSPDTLSVTATRETITIKGRRDAPITIADHDYFYRELYWGAFSRTLSLPQEVETDTVEASQKHGLLTIKLAKLDKTKMQNVRVKQG